MRHVSLPSSRPLSFPEWHVHATHVSRRRSHPHFHIVILFLFGSPSVQVPFVGFVYASSFVLLVVPSRGARALDCIRHAWSFAMFHCAVHAPTPPCVHIIVRTFALFRNLVHYIPLPLVLL